jgi:hypothetical protein
VDNDDVFYKLYAMSFKAGHFNRDSSGILRPIGFFKLIAVIYS